MSRKHGGYYRMYPQIDGGSVNSGMLSTSFTKIGGQTSGIGGSVQIGIGGSVGPDFTNVNILMALCLYTTSATLKYHKTANNNSCCNAIQCFDILVLRKRYGAVSCQDSTICVRLYLQSDLQFHFVSGWFPGHFLNLLIAQLNFSSESLL